MNKTAMACSFDSCGRVAIAKGMCKAHYNQKWRGQELRELEIHPVVLPTLEERFWAKVDASAGADGCWIWTAKMASGYGYIKVNGKFVGAHRMSYELAYGTEISGVIDHLCRNTICVNPAHLEDVTQSENLRRAVREKRLG